MELGEEGGSWGLCIEPEQGMQNLFVLRQYLALRVLALESKLKQNENKAGTNWKKGI